MKITQEVREYAAEHGMDDSTALQEGLRVKAEEFRHHGLELYVKS